MLAGLLDQLLRQIRKKNIHGVYFMFHISNHMLHIFKCSICKCLESHNASFEQLNIFESRAFWLFWGLLTFAKFMEFLKSTVQAGLNVFSYFTARRHAEFSLNFNEPQPIYASKRYVYHKSVTIFTFPYHSSLFLITRH